MVRQIAHTFLFIILYSSTIYSQDWFWQNPLPQGNRLNDIQFIGNDFIAAVGIYGTFLKSTNEGENWIYNYGLGNDLNCLHFYSSQNGYIGGNEGLILKTNDGGITWEQINTNFNSNILDIYYNSSSNSLLILTDFQILRTIDDGVVWHTSAEGNGFTHFDFPDNSSGWVCGRETMKSIDGGTNWVGVNTSYYFGKSLTFIDSSTGYILFQTGAGTGDRIIKTTDGGNTWNEQYWPIYASSIYAYNQDLAWCAASDQGDGIVIYKTINGGQQWNKILINTNDIWGPGISALTFNEYGKGIAVGSSSTRQVLLRTDDWGENWELRNDFSAADFKGISIINSSKWVVVGNSHDTGKVFITTDAGKNWNEKLNAGYGHYFLDIHITDSNFGVAVGTDIYTSEDNGDSWLQVPPNNFINTTNGEPGFNSIYILDDSIGWAAGDLRFDAGPGGYDWYWGALFKTNDAGRHWTTIAFPDFTEIKSVYFTNSMDGWIITNNKILFTEHGGTNWIEKFVASSYLTKIKFWNDEIGWAVGGNGVILKTIDGGDTWNYQNSGTSSGITDFIIINDQKLICVCFAQSGVITTLDGGENWGRPYIPVPYLRTIDFRENLGLLAGYHGLIIKITDEIINDIVDNNKQIPIVNLFLFQNYPNPFNPSTSLQYTVSSRQFVTLKIYDVLGNEIATLVNEEKPAGSYDVEFIGKGLPSGIYFYQLRTRNYIETKKMVLLR